MPQAVEFTTRFTRELKKKLKRDPELGRAVRRTAQLIIEDSTHTGLNAHKVDAQHGIWEAYVTRAARITYQRRDGVLLFRNNCRHDIIDRRQW